MNAQVLWALILKDLRLFVKNRFYALMTAVGLVMYVAVFYLMPAEVEETLELAWTGPELPGTMMEEMRAEGLILNRYADADALQRAVQAGDEPVGVVVPEDFFQQIAQGDKPRVTIYYDSSLPDEFRMAYNLLMQELSYLGDQQTLNVEAEEVLLGPDMAGQQVSPRHRMLPVLVVIVLSLETMAMASLFTAEVEAGTIRALLVTPLTLRGMYVAKGVVGVGMAFIQVALLLLVTGGLRQEPLLQITALALGALLVTGISFLIASVGRDMMSVTGWGSLVLIALAIPSFNLLLPGLASGWIKVIPSYYLVETLHQVMNFGASWRQVSGHLLALLGFAVAFLALGVYAMQRRLA